MGGAKVEAHELIANLRQTSALHLALTTLHTVFAEFLDIQIAMCPPTSAAGKRILAETLTEKYLEG